MLSAWVLEAIRKSGIGQAELGRMLTARLGRSIDRAAVNKMVKGTRDITADEMLQIAEITGVPPPYSAPPRTTHAVGYVGAGAEIVPVDDHAMGGGLEEIELPPGVPDNAVLVIVRGDSMYPRYFDGEYLFYVRDARPPQELTGRECVVRLSDGRMFVKVLRRGSRAGLFHLESWNAAMLEDQAVEWAAPVMARVNRGLRAGGR